ncbi:uncharacterized protein NPIL_22541 [Nephila pilipes]|uniref:Uncharacterized protein n=1 Tax=Nephila pilipes TaxID=299642 RepID=A0A8X6UFU6_NEPPI|nr:uncharacterized protein NPIL_22541 [Nephila pilipes]
MPPKNKPDSSMVGVYDIEIMNEDELKQYIQALKEESVRMKEAFTEHQRDKRELQILLKNTQEDILNRYEVLIQKELELQQLLCESSDTLKTEEENQLINDLGRNEKLVNALFDNFTEAQAVEMFQLGDVASLEENFQFNKRVVDDIHLAHKLISADIEEKNEEEWTRLMEMRKNSLERVSLEFNNDYHSKKLEFFDEKINTLTGVWEGSTKEDYHKNPAAEQAEKMSLYFKEIFWKNIKASANLKAKLENLEKELCKLKMSLRDAQKENTELLKATEEQKLEESTNTFSCNMDVDKRLDAVTFENDTLKEKLKQVTEERDNLRRRFISSMRKIYEKASFSSFLSEQMLISLQSSKCDSDNTKSTHKNINVSLKQNQQTETLEDSGINSENEEFAEEMNNRYRPIQFNTKLFKKVTKGIKNSIDAEY